VFHDTGHSHDVIYTAYVKAAITMTLGICRLQSFSNGMFCSCSRICTDKRVARSLCNSRASCCMRNCELRKNSPRSTMAPTTGYCLSHLRRSRPPTLRLRPKLHRFDLSQYLLQCWLYNIDRKSTKWSLSIIVQICCNNRHSSVYLAFAIDRRSLHGN